MEEELDKKLVMAVAVVVAVQEDIQQAISLFHQVKL